MTSISTGQIRRRKLNQSHHQVDRDFNGVDIQNATVSMESLQKDKATKKENDIGDSAKNTLLTKDTENKEGQKSENKQGHTNKKEQISKQGSFKGQEIDGKKVKDEESKHVSLTHKESDSSRGSITSKDHGITKSGSLKGKDQAEGKENILDPDVTRIPRKFITNWRQACGRTKDRTKELLKKWRTLPESDIVDRMTGTEDSVVHHSSDNVHHGWSVHVWATWVNRVPSEDDTQMEYDCSNLSQLQKEKLQHFFSHLLDWDKDEMISEQDFAALTERLRHFADWSNNSAEFHVLREVQQGFVDTFIVGNKNDNFKITSLEQWLAQWSQLIGNAYKMSDFPLWLQYFPKIIFLVINRSGCGIISRDELRDFYSSFLGYETQKVGEVLDLAYNNMTSNGDHTLCYYTFHLCYANFLLGRHPHGPGQFLFGPFESNIHYSIMFPIDYSALSSPPQALEPYSPHKKTNRRSVVV